MLEDLGEPVRESPAFRRGEEVKRRRSDASATTRNFHNRSNGAEAKSVEPFAYLVVRLVP